MPRSEKVAPRKPELISKTKPAGSFIERVLGIAKGPVTTPQGSRGHMSKPKPNPVGGVGINRQDAARRKLQKDF